MRHLIGRDEAAIFGAGTVAPFVFRFRFVSNYIEGFAQPFSDFIGSLNVNFMKRLNKCLNGFLALEKIAYSTQWMTVVTPIAPISNSVQRDYKQGVFDMLFGRSLFSTIYKSCFFKTFKPIEPNIERFAPNWNKRNTFIVPLCSHLKKAHLTGKHISCSVPPQQKSVPFPTATRIE